MSITDELREWWVRKFPVMDKELHKDFTAISYRTDAEHESACAEAYGNGVMSVPIAMDASAWVKLPVDADGEYIRIGDMMDSKVDHLFDGRPFEVRALVLCEDGWEAADGRFGNRYEPNSLRHHHAPTVEDVLREFALKAAGRECMTMRSDLVDEYAAKLRLREDA